MKIKTASLLLMVTLTLFGGVIVAVTMCGLSSSYDIESIWGGFEEAHLEKSPALNTLHSVIGYGGMVHHLKKAILSGEVDALELAKKDLQRAQRATEDYLRFDLNKTELEAIRTISNTLSIYASKIEKADSLDLQKNRSEYLAPLLLVDDESSLNAFSLLNKEIILQANQAKEKHSKTLALAINAQKITLYLTVITILLLIGGGYWLIRIIRPIVSITDVMTRIAREDLDVEIPGVDKQNEIGEMARAVEIFQENVYLLECVKTEVYSANLDVESRVDIRTQALKNSEETLRAILDSAVDAVITIDGTGIIKSFNSAAEGMFCLSQEEAVGQNVSILMPEFMRLSHNDYIAKYRESGEKNIIGTIRETNGCRKDGEVFPVHISVSEVKSSGRNLFTGIIRDVTEINAYQKSLQVSEDVAKKASKAKSDFVTSMSHELRTPMNAILGFAQLLASSQEEPLTQSQEEAVAEIKAAGRHLIDIINQILELNQIEAGKMPVSMQRTSPSELVQESLALITQISGEKNIELIDNIEYEELPDLLTDKMRFKQVLINLLSNAVKYNTLGGNIILSTELTGKKLRFNVEDTGKGISLYRQSQIFVPFERLGHESSEIEGTGIGLSITKEIVELMHGDIGFKSEQGKGSCFWFELPVYEVLE
ncbi:MAG: PAS domain S-box protein [Gammaproteobacteria bacterium]|nr:PAS domain S-box protein [Gammaproteobacteria bacterium]